MRFIGASYVIHLYEKLPIQACLQVGRIRRLGERLALLLGLALLWQAPAHSAAGLAPQGPVSSASAMIQVAVVIPSVLKVLENSHPPSLHASDRLDSGVSAVQRLVLLSTVRGGFCMDLLLSDATISNWKLRMDGADGARIEPFSGGYRICTRRPGRYALALHHDFDMNKDVWAAAQTALPFNWPVLVSLNSP